MFWVSQFLFLYIYIYINYDLYTFVISNIYVHSLKKNYAQQATPCCVPAV